MRTLILSMRQYPRRLKNKTAVIWKTHTASIQKDEVCVFSYKPVMSEYGITGNQFVLCITGRNREDALRKGPKLPS